MNNLTIGQAAQRAGTGIETIRFYERKGLIPELARRLHPWSAASVPGCRLVRGAQRVPLEKVVFAPQGDVAQTGA